MMVETTLAMIDSYPGAVMTDRTLLAKCVSACVECAQASTACADACLAEINTTAVTSCVRAALDCADACGATGRVVSRQTGYDTNTARALLRACAQACHSCAEECERYAAEHEYCRVCAEVCRRCKDACDRLYTAFG